MTFEDAMDDDIEMMLSSEFSRDAAIASSDGSQTVTVKANFYKTYIDVDPENQAQFMSNKPKVVVWAALVPFPLVQGVGVTVDGKTYTARKPQRNGDGSTTLLLD